MIRSAAALILAALVAAVVLSLAGESGRASILWLGWRADMTATALLVLVLLLVVVVMVAVVVFVWEEGKDRRKKGKGDTCGSL